MALCLLSIHQVLHSVSGREEAKKEGVGEGGIREWEGREKGNKEDGRRKEQVEGKVALASGAGLGLSLAVLPQGPELICVLFKFFIQSKPSSQQLFRKSCW